MRRRKNSSTALRGEEVVRDISLSDFALFVKRKVPFGSLLIGVLVGLFLAQVLGGNEVSRACPMRRC
jgi:Mg/Co/Ni transporter MgtE